MMKYFKYILGCFFYCFYLSVYGQLGFKAQPITNYDLLDESNFRVAYSFEYVWNVERSASKASDILYLDVGKKLSKCYSYPAYSVDSLTTAEMLKGKVDTYMPARESFPMEVYKKHSENQIDVVYRSPMDLPIFTYSDNYCDFEWQINSSKKIIFGYSCQKATTTFRGRTWEAWFATEIPISDGPWVFCGLSGLILEISDSQKHYVFTCMGVEKKQVPIVWYHWKYEKTNRNKLNALLTRFYENPKTYLESTGAMVVFENKSNPTSFSFPYNPIERE